MFTGIVERLGTVAAVEPLEQAIRLSVEAPGLLTDVRLGDSIAVNGCCLTVAAREPGTADLWTADVMAESLARTTLSEVAAGDRVNLERAVRMGDRLGGHLVQGHVDGTGVVLERRSTEHWDLVRIEAPAELADHLVEKGSITVDGVSLTVVEVGEDRAPDGPDDSVGSGSRAWFSVSLIPETLERTTLGFRAVGDRVNLETDVIAKHVARLVDARLAAALGSTGTGGSR